MDETTTTRLSPDSDVAAEKLDVGACWELLRGVEVGRLALVVDGRPEIFPVNFVVDRGTIVFRTADGTKLTAAEHHGGVAFETDGFDRTAGVAWSVVVKGRAEEIRELDAVIDVAQLPLRPWHGAAKHRFVCVVPDDVTGRRFPVVDPTVWDSPYTLRRTSPWE